MTTGAIDYWCNGLTPAFAARWKQAAAGLELSRSGTLARTLDDLEGEGGAVDALVQQGVNAMLVPATSPTAEGDRPKPLMQFEAVWSGLDEVLALNAAHPQRVFGMCSINPFTGMTGVRRFRRTVEDHGFVALHIHTPSWDKRLDDRDYYPFYAAASDLGVPVVAQVGHSADLTPSECGRPMTLDRAALYFPDCTFVMSHTGWPWIDEAIALATKHANVYIGTATHPPRRWPAALVEFAGWRGSEKTLFGTGFPVLHPGRAIAEVHALGLAEDACARILRHNAARIFGLDARLTSGSDA